MKGQVLKKTALRNLALPAAMLLTLAGTALAQDGIQAVGPNGLLQAKDAADAKAAKEYNNRMQTDEQYRKAIGEQQSAPASNDPWGSVRPATTPTTPAAKNATGTKAAKPAVKNAASATGTAPKNQ